MAFAARRLRRGAIMDFTHYPMGLIGGLVALFVFGVFIGTWWWYGIRAMAHQTH